MNDTGAPAATLRSLDDLISRANAIADSNRSQRRIIGITGSPGSGKTTIALALVDALNATCPRPFPWVAHVPMDGFHLADRELARLGRLDKKGAPDTFDPAGYANLLHRIHTETEETIYAPAFNRDIEQPIAGAIPIPPECGLVITEGNYLLVEEPPWRRARRELDEVWYCDLDDEPRRQRLVDRHIRFGKPQGEAVAWVNNVDEPNAVLIASTRSRADAYISHAAQQAKSCP
ncbi:nucleoside/nucleotide kinase family protein [Nocardioides sp. KR10-350]|uniref:nucleoside/nucleotide kinase family protein n=1 Tax=Nocardioides cheoyonin TaxID=3156615 RepID=UPI0032B54D40